MAGEVRLRRLSPNRQSVRSEQVHGDIDGIIVPSERAWRAEPCKGSNPRMGRRGKRIGPPFRLAEQGLGTT